MKEYTITVNGTSYDVSVEEKGGSSTPQFQSAPVKEIKVAKPTNTNSGKGKLKVDAGAAGKIFKIETAVGDNVAAGDTLLILEVMKMETPVVAAEDGVIRTIEVSVGDQVEAGFTLITMD